MRWQNLDFALRDARKSALLRVTATTYTVWKLWRRIFPAHRMGGAQRYPSRVAMLACPTIVATALPGAACSSNGC